MQPAPIPDKELRKISLHKFLYISPFLPHVDREKISLRSFLLHNKNKSSVFLKEDFLYCNTNSKNSFFFLKDDLSACLIYLPAKQDYS